MIGRSPDANLYQPKYVLTCSIPLPRPNETQYGTRYDTGTLLGGWAGERDGIGQNPGALVSFIAFLDVPLG